MYLKEDVFVSLSSALFVENRYLYDTGQFRAVSKSIIIRWTLSISLRTIKVVVCLNICYCSLYVMTCVSNTDLVYIGELTVDVQGRDMLVISIYHTTIFHNHTLGIL